MGFSDGWQGCYQGFTMKLVSIVVSKIYFYNLFQYTCSREKEEEELRADWAQLDIAAARWCF